MTNRKCNRCHKILELTAENFHHEKSRYLGFSYCCKNCTRIRKIPSYTTESYRKKKNTWKARSRCLTKYAKTHKEEISARSAVARAKRVGMLKSLPCEVCGIPNTTAHHFAGYDKINWLNVKWLCHEHHLNETYGYK